MTGYNPQKDGVRPRPAEDEPSPLDDLLGDATASQVADPAKETEPTQLSNDVTVPEAAKPHLRVAPVPADDPSIVEYKTYGIAALLVLVILYLIRKRG